MTGWAPLSRRSMGPPAEFTGFVRAVDDPSFQELREPISACSYGLDAQSGIHETDPNMKAWPEFGASPSISIPNHAVDATQNAEVPTLIDEIDRLKTAHQAELLEIEEKAATGMAASFLKRHESAIELLLETITRCTADVLRPLLSAAATEAAVKDFKSVVGELLKNAKAAEFSVQVSKAHFKHFRPALPADIEIAPSENGETDITIRIGDSVISSRLAKWSQSIAGHETDA